MNKIQIFEYDLSLLLDKHNVKFIRPAYYIGKNDKVSTLYTMALDNSPTGMTFDEFLDPLAMEKTVDYLDD